MSRCTSGTSSSSEASQLTLNGEKWAGFTEPCPNYRFMSKINDCHHFKPPNLGTAFFLIKKNFFKLIYLSWDRQRQRELGRGRERGRQRIPSRPCSTSAEPDVGLKLMKLRDHNLSPNQELNASLTEPPRHLEESFLFGNSNWNSVIVINLQKRNFPLPISPSQPQRQRWGES